MWRARWEGVWQLHKTCKTGNLILFNIVCIFSDIYIVRYAAGQSKTNYALPVKRLVEWDGSVSCPPNHLHASQCNIKDVKLDLKAKYFHKIKDHQGQDIIKG